MKHSRTRALLIAVVALIAMIAASAAPASAVTAASARVTGSGSIDPPLDATPIAHAFSFDGQADVDGVTCNHPHVGESIPISADGVDLSELP